MIKKIIEVLDEDTIENIENGANKDLRVISFDNSQGTKWYKNSIIKKANKLGIEISEETSEVFPNLFLKPYETGQEEEVLYLNMKSNPNFFDIEGSYQFPTVASILLTLDQIKKKDILVIGRSKELGLPLINALVKRDYTVIATHSKTVNIDRFFDSVDVIVNMSDKRLDIDEESDIQIIDVSGIGQGIKIGQLTTSYLLNQVTKYKVK